MTTNNPAQGELRVEEDALGKVEVRETHSDNKAERAGLWFPVA